MAAESNSANSKSSEDNALARAIAQEQRFANLAYAALDEQRDYYTQQLKKVRSQGGTGTPSARSERDSFAAHYEENLTRLRNVENRLVLGRLDSKSQKVTHIGRLTLRDENQHILLTDWRAPQSEPFYQATAAEPGDVVRRRHIQLRLREVTNVEDELLIADSQQDSELNLTGEGALFAAMSKARDGKMGDIVATIQAEQDEIIRSPAKGVLVVQGGPGTGKTAVALHRAAYLLYTHREQFSHSGVLIVGPSHSFLRYIDQVLPSLGESDVVSTTLDDLLPFVHATIEESEEAAHLKGRLIWSEIVKRAVRQILQRPLSQPKVFVVSGKKLHLTPKDVHNAQQKAHRSGKPHNEARETYAKYLVNVLAEQLAAAQHTTLTDSDWLIADVASDPDVRREINLHWLPASPQWIFEHILKWPQLLEEIAPELTPSERALLHRAPGSGFTRADIAILDEFAEHLGEFLTDEQRKQQADVAAQNQMLSQYVEQTMSTLNLGSGIVNAGHMTERWSHSDSADTLADRAAHDRSWTYGHIVVDEAQELSPMQWRMLARRNPSRSMTIVGDLDQRPSGAPEGGWPAALGKLAENHRVAMLTISYRTPATILGHATRAMDEAGYPVRTIRAARDLPNAYTSFSLPDDDLPGFLVDTVMEQSKILDDKYGNGLGTIAVITSLSQRQSIAEILLNSEEIPANTIDTEGTGLARRVQIVDARMAKGLEYDVVILVAPDEILADGPGDLYVAMTRATAALVSIQPQRS
ncbi:DNA helicase IV [Arcanobacterium pluranimalium]|uniref:HelD family protein n=1 Tax=Arcanobacterium pluranimalium TaxID=108028 RepID=UPI00195A4334|nr:AAA family ATPase [Arcanobacterium pluranimalium]MBM7825609.1 DNA helicase IV [Arcanobacterium pluranimalium]